MKQTLTVLFICIAFNATSQTILAFGNVKLIQVSKHDDNIVKPYAIDLVAIDLIYAYEKECERDSIPQIYKWVAGTNSDGSLQTECRIEYVHKEPTFEGFIEYIHKIDPRK